MQTRRLILLPLCLLASVVAAQTAAPASAHRSERWSYPAPAASVTASFSDAVPDQVPRAQPSLFKFKRDRHRTWAPEPAPPGANDKAAVMGTPRPWLDGHPPVVCAQTPTDPVCR